MFLLGSDDPAPFEELKGNAALLFVCDHASNRVPASLDHLGLPPERFAEHIAVDIGAGAMTRLLAASLDATAVLAGYSRLVVDCNRAPEDPSWIPAESDGIAIPGNRGLDDAACSRRRNEIYSPYHTAIARCLGAMPTEPALISIHSFTPSMQGVDRPWHVGVLWDGDARIAGPLIATLKQEPGINVGDNQPYSAREPRGYTVSHHAKDKGLRHVAIELRQNLIASDAGAQEWAERLTRILTPILTR